MRIPIIDAKDSSARSISVPKVPVAPELTTPPPPPPPRNRFAAETLALCSLLIFTFIFPPVAVGHDSGSPHNHQAASGCLTQELVGNNLEVNNDCGRLIISGRWTDNGTCVSFRDDNIFGGKFYSAFNVPAKICAEYQNSQSQTDSGLKACPDPTTITDCGTKTDGIVFVGPDPVIPEGNIEVSPATLSLDEGGDDGTFTVKLDTEPNADVTIAITSADAGAVTVNPASLTFTTANYGTAQTVTVTAEQDADGEDEDVKLTISATGGIDADDEDVDVSVDDDEPPSAIVVSGGDSVLDVTEGETATFTVHIDPPSTGIVSVSVDVASRFTSIITASPATLMFAANATAAQTVTVTGVQDDDNRRERAEVTLSADSIDDDVTKPVAVKDDEIPSGNLVLDTARLSLREGGGGTFDVSLDTEPSEEVTVAITSADAGAVSVNTASLTFTASNYSDTQPVSVTAPHDIDVADERVDITLSASGGIVATDVDKSVAVDDDDEAGSLVMLPSLLQVVEGGRETFLVRLGTMPTVASVRVALANTNPAVTLEPAFLDFTDADWNASRTVAVSAAQDENADNGSDTITGAFENGTGNYAEAANPRGATIAITTLDRPGDIVVSTSMVDLMEGGEPVEFTVRLGEVPINTDTVTLTLSNSNRAVAVSPDVLLFTRDNWNEERIVSLQAGEDSDREDGYDFVVLNGAGGNYSRSMTVVSVSVEENDDDGGVIGGTPGRSGVYALAIPPETGSDSSDIRIRCKQSSPCAVYFDCTAQEDGDAIQGWLPDLIPAWGTRTVGASDIVRHTGDSWFGKGRLGCLLRSKERISAQVWTRSGDGVLVNNSAVLDSALDPGHGNRRVDIESIPSPDGDERTNLRIRCLAPENEHCTRTAFTCFADDGMRHEGALGRIDRLTVRHLQTSELASLIDHRWEGMGLSCELRSDNRFTVQVMTRTGGGGALVNNSATGTLEN